jgi:hypothetical protein
MTPDKTPPKRRLGRTRKYSAREAEIVTRVLDAIGGQYRQALAADEPTRHAHFIGFNDGVSAAEEAVVAALRRMGFPIVRMEDGEDHPGIAP